ncbi:MAG: ABC transporter permease [Parvibaculaceae bacterium]|nr:ABC transporter permease [Parvibaculaceae bacterium]
MPGKLTLGYPSARTLRKSLPLVVLAVVVVALIALPLYSSAHASAFSINNSLQNAASLGLLALGVGLTMIIGEFDLSSLGVYAIGGMIAVKYGADFPVMGMLLALALAVVVGGVQGWIIARTEISSVPLTLGGYIILLGASHLVSNSQTLAYANYDVGMWLDGIFGFVLSPRIAIVLGIFVLTAAFMGWTQLGREIRAVGGDRRASRASGVQVDRIIVGIFIASAFLSALGGALFALSSAAAKPDLGLSPFIFAVTAVLLGGVSLAGGRGGAMGIVVGVVSLSLLETLFSLLGTPIYMVNVIRGALLLVVVVIEAPDLRRALITVRRAKSA